MKVCNRCFKEKALYDFYPMSASKDGVARTCKTCDSARLHARGRTAKGIKEKLLSRLKSRGIPYDKDMSWKDLPDIPEKCPVLGVPLTVGDGPYSPSFDRIDSAIGYFPANLQVMSARANRMKSDATPEELLMFADWIYKTYGES